MSFHLLNRDYPFQGASCKFVMPPGAFDWQPKAWGTTATIVPFVDRLVDITADFIADNIQVGDIAYVCGSDHDLREAYLVTEVVDFTTVTLAPGIDVAQEDVIYKIGMKAAHTLHTLQSIVGARGIESATIHWSTVWTSAYFFRFDHTESGDVYVCHNPTIKKLEELKLIEYKDHEGNPDPNPWSILNPEPVP